MNPLPQRKKSAEEIAKLRESFGVPGQSPEAEARPASVPEKAPKAPVAEVPEEPVAVLEPPPIVVLPAEPGLERVSAFHDAKPFHPSRHAASVPVLHAEGETHLEKRVEPSSEPESKKIKVVRSLRKSEQGPVAVPSRTASPADSKLPVHRHSDQEISRIRRLESIGTMSSPQAPRVLTAHPVLVIPGYLLVAAATAGIYYFDFPLAANAACVAVALSIALFILIRKPLSRHHAAFLGMASLLILVFGTLHYFPQIQHGT